MDREETVNIAITRELHTKIKELSKMFGLTIGETSILILKNGIKNIISIQISRLNKKIDKLKKFDK